MLNMPIYEYKCECGKEGEFILPLNTRPPTCKCGKVMEQRMSATNFVMGQTGKQMALDTLNSNVVGGRHKDWVEAHGAAGLESTPKTVW